MSRPVDPIPDDAMNLYGALIATHPNVERKGATMPYTAVNGHMFSFMTRTGRLALRLPEHERDAFLKEHDAALCEQHGTVLKEYVEVPESLLKNTPELTKFFDISYADAASLQPKSTRKKKAPP